MTFFPTKFYSFVLARLSGHSNSISGSGSPDFLFLQVTHTNNKMRNRKKETQLNLSHRIYPLYLSFCFLSSFFSDFIHFCRCFSTQTIWDFENLWQMLLNFDGKWFAKCRICGEIYKNFIRLQVNQKSAKKKLMSM